MSSNRKEKGPGDRKSDDENSFLLLTNLIQTNNVSCSIQGYENIVRNNINKSIISKFSAAIFWHFLLDMYQTVAESAE